MVDWARRVKLVGMKNAIIVLLIIIILAFGGYILINKPKVDDSGNTTQGEPVDSTPTPVVPTPPPVETPPVEGPVSVIGKSVEDRDISAYNYPPNGEASGPDDKRILFVGGVHGAYSWNAALVAYELMDYLAANPSIIPEGVKVTVIPVLNPDGLAKVVENPSEKFTAAEITEPQATQVAGRFNGNEVDLNRNFDCDWQASGKWQSKTVSGGSAAFSEPESQAIRDYVEAEKPVAVIAWYSAAGGVYASNCHNGVLPETLALVNAYAKASGYPAHENFDFYKITGDMLNWLAKKEIPAMSVLLTNHTSTDWAKNEAGIKAILSYYAK